MPEYKPIDSADLDVAGRRVPSATFSQTCQDGRTTINQIIVLVDGASAYLIAWIAPQARFASLDSVLKKIRGVVRPASAVSREGRYWTGSSDEDRRLV